MMQFICHHVVLCILDLDDMPKCRLGIVRTFRPSYPSAVYHTLTLTLSE